MSNAFPFPRILVPGNFTRLNADIIDLLGVPLFFSAPALTHPRADTAIGALYEAVTGLYIVYHDYGIEIFSRYMEFCEQHVLSVGFSQTDGADRTRHATKTCHQLVADRLKFHWKYDLSHLRSALCHGSLENGIHARDIMRTIGHYEKRNRPICGQWPDAIADLTEDQCTDILQKLTADVDLMVDYLLNCAKAIAADPVGLLTDWRKTLADKVFSTDDDNRESYFNESIVWDVKASIVSNAKDRPHKEAVKGWLASIRPKIQNGGYTSADPEELAKSLFAALKDHYFPPVVNTKASAGTMLGDLFADLLSNIE